MVIIRCTYWNSSHNSYKDGAVLCFIQTVMLFWGFKLQGKGQRYGSEIFHWQTALPALPAFVLPFVGKTLLEIELLTFNYFCSMLLCPNLIASL